MPSKQDDIVTNFYFKGLDSVAGVEKAIEKINGTLARLQTGLQTGAIGFEEFERKTDKLMAPLAGLRDRLADLEGAHAKAGKGLGQVGRQLDDVAEKAGKGRSNLQKFAYGLDDLQYVGEQGLRPVINNAMQMNAVFGITVLAVDMAIRHWDKLAEAMGQVSANKHLSNMDAIEKHVKDLGSAAETSYQSFKLLNAEQDRLDRAKKAESSVRGIEARGTKDEEENGKAFAEAIGRAGGGKAVEATIFEGYKRAGTLGQFNPKLAEAAKKVQAVRDRIELVKEDQRRNPGALGFVDEKGDTQYYEAYLKQLNDQLYNGSFLFRKTFGKAGTAPLMEDYNREMIATDKNARASIDQRLQGATRGNRGEIDWARQMMGRGGASQKTQDDLYTASVKAQQEKAIKQTEALAADALGKFKAITAGAIDNMRDKQKAVKEGLQESERLKAKAAQQHKTDVRGAVSDFGGELADAAAVALAEGFDEKRIKAIITDRLKKVGVRPELLADAMAEIFHDADVAVKRKMAAAVNRGEDAAAGRADVVREAEQKIENRDRRLGQLDKRDAKDEAAQQAEQLAAMIHQNFAIAPGRAMTPAQARSAAKRALKFHEDDGLEPEEAVNRGVAEERTRVQRDLGRGRPKARKPAGMRSVPVDDPSPRNDTVIAQNQGMLTTEAGRARAANAAVRTELGRINAHLRGMATQRPRR